MERKDTVMNEMETLKQWIEDSKRIVFFGGAGVSTESGIPDFSKRGWALQSEVCISAGNHYQPFVL